MNFNNQFSIVVLPFVSMSNAVDDEFFSDGITEEIINSLSRIQNLKVISRTSSFFYKGKEVKIEAVGKELNVAMALGGSVRKYGKNVRISVQLINTKDGFQYWSESYTHQLEDVFEVQDQISLQVTEKIREYLGHFNYEEPKKVQIKVSEVYELYLMSRYNFNKFQKEDVLLAAEQIETVIKADPFSARYYAAKGIYYGYLAVLNVLPLDETLEIVKNAAEKALSIDKTNAEAHYAMMILYFVFEWDIDKAQHYNNLALKYRPNYPDALFSNSLIALVSQNYDTALEGVSKAITLDPFSPSLNYYYAAILERKGMLDEALKTIEEGLQMAPHNTNSHQLKGIILTRLGHYNRALKHYRKVPVGTNDFITYYPGLGIVYATMGDWKKAKEYLQRITNEPQNINIAYEENALVIINVLLGNFDAAFEHITNDIKEKKYYLKYYRVNPVFDLLKKDKRYKLLDQVFKTKGKKISGAKKKYVKSGITDLQVGQINDALIAMMQEQQPYLNPRVSLKMLAKELSKSANHISQVINDKHNKNFFDFINDYRIEEMISLLKQPKNKRFTLLALAHEAGFNSKTTFNVAFKKLKGKTPRVYFKSLNLID